MTMTDDDLPPESASAVTAVGPSAVDLEDFGAGEHVGERAATRIQQWPQPAKGQWDGVEHMRQIPQ